MDSHPLARDRIVTTLVHALEQLDFVNAVWQGGAAAFNRVDEWSDIDLVIDARDERADDVWPHVERAIESLGPVELYYRIPQPPLGLHSQRLYRFRDAGPFLLLDIAVFRASASNKLLDPWTHGHVVVHFDRTGATSVKPNDDAARHAELNARIASLRTTFPLFQSFVLKELNRGNAMEALQFYHSWTLRPLVELLRIRYCPQRYQFHTRYIHYDLPRGIIERLMPMFFVRDPANLASRRDEAERWVNELLAEHDASAQRRQA